MLRRPGSKDELNSLNPLARTRKVCPRDEILVKKSFPEASVTPRRTSSIHTIALGWVVMMSEETVDLAAAGPPLLRAGATSFAFLLCAAVEDIANRTQSHKQLDQDQGSS